jgi:hypothetical protein
MVRSPRSHVNRIIDVDVGTSRVETRGCTTPRACSLPRAGTKPILRVADLMHCVPLPARKEVGRWNATTR